MSKGRAASKQQSSLVRVRTDEGIEGWGESATAGGNYLPTFTGSTRAAIIELASHLVGKDPTNISEIQNTMNSALLGHANAKSAIDIACWDIFGKSVNRPIAQLLGGVLQESFPLYYAIPLKTPSEMAEFARMGISHGIKRFQLKVGGNPYEDAERVRQVIENTPDGTLVIADANGGWNLQAALIACEKMSGLDVYIEQPCRDIADCATVKRNTVMPLILDELINTPADMYKAKYEAGAGSVNLKLGRLGGITPLVRMRNLAQDLDMTFCLEDMWGGDVISAAIAHVSASADPLTFLHSAFYNDWTKEHVAGHEPRSINGVGSIPTGPGLGITINMDAIGKPLAVIND